MLSVYIALKRQMLSQMLQSCFDLQICKVAKRIQNFVLIAPWVPVGIPKHFEAKEEHDDYGGVVGVDLRDEGGNAEADQRRDDRHDDQRRD